MSKSSRRRLLFASFRDVAFASLLSAALVGSVGCAGGSNPFCCDSKEKDKIDNLERAQSLDENEKNSTSTEEDSDEPKEEKKTIFANNPQTDGSGDASSLVAAQETPKTFAQEPQEAPVTISTTAAAQESTADSVGLLQPPVLPSQVQTSEAAAPAPTPSETATPETSDAPTSEATAPTDDETPANESQDAQNKENAQEETPKEESTESQDEKTPEAPVNVARSPRRDGPQRAATRQVAQRAASQTVAVPQTRAAATLPASTPVVTFRTRVVVP